MSVLLEALSVVVRCASVDARYPGGMAELEADCPNRTFCTDGHVARVGFMTPADVGTYLDELARHGLAYIRDGSAIDVVVVDQHQGPMALVDWLEWFRTDVDGVPVELCCLKGTNDGSFAAPEGWLPGENDFAFAPNEEMGRLTLVGREGVNDVYRDDRTGELQYVARASGKPKRFWRNPKTGRLARVLTFGRDKEADNL